MATHELDQFILAAANLHWQKVAMVIAKALTEPDLDFPETEDDAAFVASRIEVLIGCGQLEVHGNPSNWRYSEVRRAAPATGAA